MLSRGITKTSKPFRSFSSLGSKLFNLPNTSDPFYSTATANPLTTLDNHEPNYVTPQGNNVSITELESGVTVVSETPDVPGTVGVQVLLNVGTRDEDSKTSGSLLSIQNTYYKTVLNTNEAINYGMVQMSGGNFTMDYDQESTVFKASCLEHDVVDILGMVSDCALEPRSVVAANVAIYKNKNTHARETNNNSGFAFNDTLLRTAYGLQGLGMPLLGLHGNIEYLNASVLQSFQMNNITPNRIFVGGSNVENHDEFVELVGNKLSNIQAMESEANGRAAATYTGGEQKSANESNRTDIAIAFETSGWNASNALALQLAAAILGEHSSFTITNPHQSPSNRSYNELVSQLSYVDDAAAINFNFSDSGLFGFRIGGPSSEAQSLFDNAIGQLQSLSSNVSDAELQAAKNTLAVRILRGLENPGDRLTETLKNINTYGRVVHGNYLDWINNVTAEDIQSAVSQVLAGTPTIIVNGGRASNVNTNF